MKLRILLGLLLAVRAGYAQKTPVEVFAGHKAVNTQLIFNQRFSPTSKLGVFSLVGFNMPYEKTDRVFNYYIIQALATFNVTQNIRLIGGAFSKNIDYGPTAGVQGLFPLKRGLLLLHNRHELVQNYRMESLALFEYRPALTEKLSLYFRVQALTETNFKQHQRSFETLRLGFSSGPFRYGAGATFDQFGPEPITRSNFGAFLGAEI